VAEIIKQQVTNLFAQMAVFTIALTQVSTMENLVTEVVNNLTPLQQNDLRTIL
jgi:hypothetical protein